jgi:hypothetical protein
MRADSGIARVGQASSQPLQPEDVAGWSKVEQLRSKIDGLRQGGTAQPQEPAGEDDEVVELRPEELDQWRRVEARGGTLQDPRAPK